jgi:hypothetical protein
VQPSQIASSDTIRTGKIFKEPTENYADALRIIKATENYADASTTALCCTV